MTQIRLRRKKSSLALCKHNDLIALSSSHQHKHDDNCIFQTKPGVGDSFWITGDTWPEQWHSDWWDHCKVSDDTCDTWPWSRSLLSSVPTCGWRSWWWWSHWQSRNQQCCGGVLWGVVSKYQFHDNITTLLANCSSFTPQIFLKPKYFWNPMRNLAAFVMLLDNLLSLTNINE